MEWVWGVFKSTINYALKFVYSVGSIKAVLFTGMFWLFKTIWDYALGLLDGFSLASISDAIGGMGEGLLWFLVAFRLDVGLPMIIAAAILRFTIRRIPIIG